MFGHKKKQEPAPVPVDGLHVKQTGEHSEIHKTFEFSEDEFIKQVLKQDGGQIDRILHSSIADNITIYYTKYKFD